MTTKLKRAWCFISGEHDYGHPKTESYARNPAKGVVLFKCQHCGSQSWMEFETGSMSNVRIIKP